MLGSPLLGTAVGLALLFATTALLCSGVTETISSLLQMRARYLLTGIRAILDAAEPESSSGSNTGNPGGGTAAPGTRTSTAGAPTMDATGSLCGDVLNPATTRAAADAVRAMTESSQRKDTPSLACALFDDPILRSLQSRRVFPASGRARIPQYISARTFARALVDLLAPTAPGGQTGAQARLGRIKDKVAELPPHLALRRQLLTLLERAGGELDAFELAVEQWYDEQMAKINGWYKRWARVVLGVVGLVVAVLLNIDTFAVTRTLYVDAPVQQAVVASAEAGALCGNTTGEQQSACVQNELAELGAAGLPIGYPDGCAPPALLAERCWWTAGPVTAGDRWLRVFGWVITAFAVSFGAPFWFEALSRLGSLRSAGTPPPDSTRPASR
jgi:hypothetical protein